MLDGILLVSQEERQTAEHEQEPADVALVVQLLVELLRPLRVAARENVVALPLRDERGLEVRVRDRRAVAELLRELERALDVVVCGDVVAQPAVTARAPLQDVRAEQVARQTGTLGERRVPRRTARSRSTRSRACSDRPRAGRGRRRDRDPRSRHAPTISRARSSSSIASFAWPTSCRAQASPVSSAELERSSRRALHARPDLAIRLDGVVVLLRGGQRLGASRATPRDSRDRPSRSRTTRRTGSTPSRSASQATVDSVGRVFPRSIWLMYSFEKRAPASCVCVRPAETRSVRTRSPRRAPGVVGASGVAVSYMPTSVNPDRAPLALPRAGDVRIPLSSQVRLAQIT